ncbi:uncharacterized protein LOC128991634 [Macrosteles quadrilineatus]|uniref:uncharacterized protein LOC128991634 n=1 Tax=Macrosteles quadrilineatus TaxID=74068 RepID=UPI0023E310BC|nr:uncharacterized protein LOC128991634 [Macrosteles quadrilineatus]
MDILDVVIQTCIPPEWQGVNSSNVTRQDYVSNRYRLFELPTHSTEYSREMEVFREGDLYGRVTKVQRVQNPFQLGRLLLRQEQKKNRDEIVNEVKYYHPLTDETQLQTALEYNMDVRRYGNKDYRQGDRDPRFYRTPKEAFDSITTCQYILVCVVLSTGEYESFTRQNDTEYMPVYVIKLV